MDVLRSENERLQHELERIDDDTVFGVKLACCDVFDHLGLSCIFLMTPNIPPVGDGMLTSFSRAAVNDSFHCFSVKGVELCSTVHVV